MNLDDQLRRYFGASNLEEVSPAALAAGLDHMRVDLGLTTDPEHRFALWVLLHMFGVAPDLDEVFESEAEREAARNFMDLSDRAGDDA